MTERAGDLAGLVELHEFAVEADGLIEGEHRTLPAGHDDGVVGADFDRGDLARRLDEGGELGVARKPRLTMSLSE